MRRIIGAVTALLITVLGMVAFAASPASAHAAVMNASAKCTDTGWEATFTVTNDAGYGPAKFSGSGNTDLDRNYTAGASHSTTVSKDFGDASASMSGTMKWSDGVTSNASKTVTRPGKCQVPDAKDATASVSTTPGTCDTAGSATHSETHASLVGNFDTSPGSHTANWTADKGHTFANGDSTKSEGYTVDAKKTGDQCAGPQPPAVVKNVSDEKWDCAGYFTRGGTITTEYVLVNGDWVLGTPGPVVWGDFVKQRNLTADEATRACPNTKPTQEKWECDGYYTGGYDWNGTEWVPGDLVKQRDLTQDELANLWNEGKCLAPVDVPAAPAVTDDCGVGNAAWVKPENTDTVTWDEVDGVLTASTTAGNVFTDKTTTHAYGEAPETNTAACPTPPVTPPTTPVTPPVVVHHPVLDCSDYATQAQAQAALVKGNTALDGDDDGVACERPSVAAASVLPNTGSPTMLFAAMVAALGLMVAGAALTCRGARVRK